MQSKLSPEKDNWSTQCKVGIQPQGLFIKIIAELTKIKVRKG